MKTLYYTTANSKAGLKAVAFSRDERYVYAVADDWTLFRLPLAIGDLVADSRKLAAGASPKDEDCLKYLRQAKCAEVPGLR